MSVVSVVRMSTPWRETLRRWRKLLPLALGLAALNLQAQTCAVPGRDGGASVSGVVNTYYVPGNGTYSSGSTSMALGGATGAATAVAPGDLVVLMQMQCANINSSNTANYGAGDGTGRGYTEPGTCQAGRYEYVRAGAATTASSLDLRGNSLSGTYVQDPTGIAGRRTFQVIRVPQHAALTLGGTVNAPYWNGNTGGVVVLDVAGNLNWNGQAIDVSGRGFRGGGAVFWDNVTFIDTDNPPDWVTTLATMPHATKGEGIAGTPRFVYNQSAGRQDLLAGWVGYSNGDHGRGAPGNAGGGGDNRDGGRDNGGGGGGGNGGIGGLGGYGWKSSSWNSTFTASDVDLRGIGGGAFGSAAPHRVVMGGGGGAGGSNNAGNPPANSSGGAGGGIVIVRAGSMTGAGTVNADGADGQTQPVEDGAGGGVDVEREALHPGGVVEGAAAGAAVGQAPPFVAVGVVVDVGEERSPEIVVQIEERQRAFLDLVDEVAHDAVVLDDVVGEVVVEAVARQDDHRLDDEEDGKDEKSQEDERLPGRFERRCNEGLEEGFPATPLCP